MQLYLEKKTSRFDRGMVLDVFPKIMNTFVVMLSDEGISASQKLLRPSPYTSAVLGTHTRISRNQARSTQEAQEVHSKGREPNQNCMSKFGKYTPTHDDCHEVKFTWRDMCLPYLMESFDRAVL